MNAFLLLRDRSTPLPDEDYGGSSDQNDGICVVTCGNGRKDFVDSSSSLSATNLNGR